MQATERLYLTAEKDRVVREGDPKAAFLYAAPGDEIPDSAVRMFGLEKLLGKPGRENTEPGGQVDGAQSPEGGSVSPSGAESPPDDLTRIKGIGPATAEKLKDGGIASFKDMAGLKLEVPLPQVLEGIGSREDWVSWTTQARLLMTERGKAGGASEKEGDKAEDKQAAKGENKGGGLTINKRRRGSD